jgi:hypothetical protein
VRPSPIVIGGTGQRAFMYAHVTVEDNKLEMEARLPNGTVIDRLELVKDSQGMYQEEVMTQAVDLDLALKLAYFWSRDYSDRYIRRDPEGTFSRVSRDESTAEVMLHLPVAISDAQLVLHPMQEPGYWQTDGQIVDINGNRVSFELNMPPDVQNISGSPFPALILPVNLKVGGRTFESAEIRPRIDFPSLDRPVLNYPRHSVTTKLRPEYSWYSVPGGSIYQLQVAVSNFSSFSDIRLDTQVEDTVFVQPADAELKPGTYYYWRSRALQAGDGLYSDGTWSNTGVFQTAEVTRSGDEADVPVATKLLQNYPNPFNAGTVIKYQLAGDGDIRLDVYDVLGRHIAVLAEGRRPSGQHEVRFDAGSLPGGVYLYRLRAGDETRIRRMLLVK